MSLLNFFESLRTKLDIVEIIGQYTNLQRKGKEFLGVCPFHSERTPSFTVNPIKQFYHCFGCSAHGDVIKFLSTQNGLSYKEAAIKIAQEKNIPIPKYSKEDEEEDSEAEKIYTINNLANQFFQKSLDHKAVKYLNNRNIPNTTIQKFALGFAPKEGLKKYLEQHNTSLSLMHKAGLIAKGDSGNIYEVFRNRVMFPIFNIYGKIIGFGGRTMENIQPKYLNSPETLLFKKSESFYGENRAISASYKMGNIILVEGYMDVISMHEAGFTNTLASLGTAINEKHLLKLWKYTDEIILCLDGDAAGVKATKRTIELALPLIDSNKKVSFLSLPAGGDPDDILKKYGAKYVERLILEKKALSEMIWHIESLNQNLATPEEQTKLNNTLTSYCLSVKDLMLRKYYLNFFKNKMWQASRNSNATNKNTQYYHHNQNSKYTSKNTKKQHISTLSILEVDETSQIEYNLMAILCNYAFLLNNEIVAKDLKSLYLENTELSKFKNWLIQHISTNEAVIVNIEEIIDNAEINNIHLSIKNKQNIYDSNFSGLELWNFFLKNHELVNLQRNYDKILTVKGNKIDLTETRLYYKKVNAIKSLIDELKKS
jgi:DNA primase